MKTKRFPITVPRDPEGFKTREAWIAEALGATWTRRRGHTVASANRAAQYAALCAIPGLSASSRSLASDRTPYTFSHPRLGKLGLSAMLKVIGFVPSR